MSALLGVTGAVGAGKSTVCALLAERGYARFDLDDAAALALEEARGEVERCLRESHPQLCGAAGAPLDKGAIIAALFADAALRARLEAILRPRLLAAIERWAAGLDGPGVLDAALLFEAGLDRLCAETLCVCCALDERRRRVEARATSSSAHFAAIEAAQWTQEEKARRAQALLDTGCPREELPARLDGALAKLDARDLAGRWSALWARLGARSDPTALGDELLARWSEPHRSYHSLSHLRACLRLLDSVARPPDCELLELALWFHDAIYDPRAPDNEEESARLAERALRGLGLPEASLARVAALVLATKSHLPGSDPLAPLLLDIDLSVLGAGPALFAAYERGIAAEYAWVPPEIYARERRRILAGFLARERIFLTAQPGAALEERARQNLRRSLGREEIAARPFG